MTSAPPGYSRPTIVGPVDGAAEKSIAATCPGSVVAPWVGDAPATHPYWGPHYRVATGWATDPEVRFKGSSGGAVTALALHALARGLVDRVVHVTASAADPASNAIAVSTSARDVIAGAGSRYVSSSPLVDIERVLADGGRAAFIGKPCDVSALRLLAQSDARVDAHVPLMLAFFCAGIPSRSAVGRVLGELRVSENELAAFRYRGDGWPGKARAVTHDGRISEMTYAQSWGAHLSKEVQFRCKICPDAVGGVADIACADAWYGGETGYPRFEEMDGRSLIVSRTARGEALLVDSEEKGDLILEGLDIGQIELMQPGQARRKRLVRGRVAALKACLQPRPQMTGLLVEVASRRARPVEQIRNFLGSVRRSMERRP
ncbi:Coenzyme F420 hydrogenase/dehydrogenase, beta subunit C-terminal domain [uncultured Phenylobacterium sp.]|uniref:Coenzyme F420 hydrogenase/dehydrogenase, beta subunit C-terminal domain n=1 Tax=uncultured Phenylobacterium sp. TaxID=349273 RepID=UPI0025E1364E|nr:Coenzyme F420 hydrogenase/dehydrogenase, beta subunit C-terminal domain [uncultured Phenylobacterium sp.]